MEESHGTSFEEQVSYSIVVCATCVAAVAVTVFLPWLLIGSTWRLNGFLLARSEWWFFRPYTDFILAKHNTHQHKYAHIYGCASSNDAHAHAVLTIAVIKTGVSLSCIDMRPPIKSTERVWQWTRLRVIHIGSWNKQDVRFHNCMLKFYRKYIHILTILHSTIYASVLIWSSVYWFKLINERNSTISSYQFINNKKIQLHNTHF